jgi:hypothetical protein
MFFNYLSVKYFRLMGIWWYTRYCLLKNILSIVCHIGSAFKIRIEKFDACEVISNVILFHTGDRARLTQRPGYGFLM